MVEKSGNPKKEINRKKLKGRVVSTKNEKTALVLVETLKSHPIYKKKVKRSKKYMIHDERNEANIGDYVEIMEGRKLSKRKTFFLNKILERERGEV